MPDFAPSVRTAPETSAWSLFLYAAFAVLGAVALVNLIVAEEVRIAVTVMVSMILIGLAFYNIRLSIASTLVYLVFLGDIRRMLIPVAGWSETDPLLLIGPVVAICLFAYAWASGALPINTPIAKWMLGLMAIMVLQIFNPRQGGMMVGVAGVMFMMIPLFWYWIGRAYATPDFMRKFLFWIVVPLGFLAMLMAYYQLFYGYLPYQMNWYEIAGYIALGKPETGLAPISFFSSSTEHNSFLVVVLVILWASLLKRKWAVLLLIPAVFLAVFFSGVRGPVVKFLVIGAVLWAVLGEDMKSWISRGLLAFVVALVGFGWSLSQIGPGGNTSNPMDGLSGVERRMARQSMLLDSHDRQGGTLRVHGYMMLNGYLDGITNPLGAGLGATTKAAAKFTGRSVATEVDTSDVMRSTGLFGGIAYHVIIFLTIISAFRYWRRTRSALALSIIGILGVTGLSWLVGGQYAMAPLIWLCVGALDRFENMPNTEVA